MLEKILKLYTMGMANDVRSPLPHLVGPPGCGKSTMAEQAADIIGCTLHIINVSRISPLELEGVQMPVAGATLEDSMKLELLHATFWTQLKEGDILLLDEFLRAFPEVYNGLLDILTSRQVGGYKLPKVFIMAASNSVTTYDSALEDRLLHLPVPDPRTNKANKKALAQIIVDQLGLAPLSRDSFEMAALLDKEVLPMYELLDQFKGNGVNTGANTRGHSVRNLIGQAQLREVKSNELKELLDFNNLHACNTGKAQYVLAYTGTKSPGPGYMDMAQKLKGNPKLTKIQALNLDLNLQLIEMENIRHEKGTTDDDDEIFDV